MAPQAEALLEMLGAYRRAECEKLLERAASEARRIAAEARRAARERLHAVAVAERERATDQIRALQAQSQTLLRQHRQKERARVLAAGWPELEAELTGRWSEPASRRLWVDALVDRARECLPGGTWRIAHPPDWGEAERSRVDAMLTEWLGARPSFEPDAGIRAGLRITAANNILDASLAGLLEDRAEIEARLLDHWERFA